MKRIDFSIKKIINSDSPEEYLKGLINDSSCDCKAQTKSVCINCLAKAVHLDRAINGPKRIKFYNILRNLEKSIIKPKISFAPEKILAFLKLIRENEEEHELLAA